MLAHLTKTDHNQAVIAIFLTLSGFIIYFLISSSVNFKQILISKYGKEKASEYFTYLARLAGVLFLGIIPGILMLTLISLPIKDFGVSASNLPDSVFWIIGLGIIIIPLSFFASKKEDNLNMYPQIRKKTWSGNTLFFSAFTWILYLIAYEFLFRGLLLFSCVREFGYWPAIAINLFAYSLVHIPKGIKESLGAIPIGFILCVITISTGTIWVALFAHIIMALSNEWFSLYHHPEMKLVIRNKQF